MAPKLSADIQKKLLCFNSALPRKNMEVWVTMEEMRDRLIDIGVVACFQRKWWKTQSSGWEGG